ncbi:GDSL-type esterase/lipase family protein [Chitinophaga nivalis]|uniref:GDSL-type esterase/lipase family protein n=1 Tax=Chitinophaga nivalis TaxID=2991709 RepID=A0ABT3IWN6_9BACT|nr:GDSL-type esterase/lipase family protein [Chitinophaga nivalis]MCW3461926.1 GDSL-type esterase/lipase family protein [Chitinophaga nivalis]MCW3488383.1 GDSL-type esterase/lipase family protein [Chitinophaga nivalis]
MNTGGQKNLNRRLITIVLLLLTGITTYAQQIVTNNIQQDTALYGVFKALLAADSDVVSILHLGDSHVQAGYFPLATGMLLQQQFGYAGRGYIFPYNLAGTNGPEDFRWSSTARWQSERVVDRYKSPILGPGAITLSSQQDVPALSFTAKADAAMDNNFRKVTLLYDAGNLTSTVVPQQDAAVSVTPAPFPGSPTLSSATLTFPQTSQSFQVRWEGTAATPFRFYGAVMENGHNGVLYHSIGINGAMYQHYNEINNILLAQMAVLRPQLVIISLGTNEAYGRFDPLVFRDEIDKTVQLIRSQNPAVNILLTTPPDCMRAVKKATRKKVGKRKYKTFYSTVYYPNPYISMVTQQIVGYARQHGIACWNFNAINKAQKSRFDGGWAPDHIHFNVKGYQVQGQLLYEALQQSYSNYSEQKKKIQ